MSPAEDQGTDTLCLVCGDKCFGKHYGAYTCHGCSRFFQRVVLNTKRVKPCRLNKTCVMTKEKRIVCRYCRYQKCLSIGMKPGAVDLNKRDTNRKRPKAGDVVPERIFAQHRGNMPNEAGSVSITNSPSGSALATMENKPKDALNPVIQFLLNTEHQLNNVFDYFESHQRENWPKVDVPLDVAVRNLSLVSDRFKLNFEPRRVANYLDLRENIRRCFVLFIDWANMIDEFRMLSPDDQVELIKSRHTPYAWWYTSRRGIESNCQGVILCNGSYVPVKKDTSQLNDATNVTTQLQYDVIEPTRKMELDNAEFCLLKAICFFNTENSKISEDGKKIISAAQNKYINALYDYLRLRLSASDAAMRLGELMLLLSPLTTLSFLMNENVQLAVTLGTSHWDKFLLDIYRN
uniref:Uncharacterized protein n=1 Tax=Plectus sambesii TaxID=2011161 RepID=A0A914VRU6_9BILA